MRRGRKPPSTLVTPEELQSFTIKSETKKTLHTAREPLINSLSSIEKVVNSSQSEWIATSGKDGNVYVVDSGDMSIVANVKAHKASVNESIFCNGGNVIVTASEDSTVKSWRLEEPSKGGYKLKGEATFTDHSASVTSVSAHPLSTMFCSAGVDGLWTLCDVETGTTISKIKQEDGNFALTSSLKLCDDSS